ncbi:hypothetical protein Poli38472_004095 [Pythium oligandrum]|uniref:Protein kinase domain-containing protein n=1 Tax=Pythium oligandrum TaxID=41045 RepID=A0A8K1FJR1_PYTOL|nr:hypothetical protein Poli38472_004095 [Pythium oligandrum]|eukprot:TMW66330.1 hypothetical protein Poli38472_004095 [Pythium oligandrum]
MGADASTMDISQIMSLFMSLPPLPKPPIFDSPYNPYFGNVQDSLLDAYTSGMIPSDMLPNDLSSMNMTQMVEAYKAMIEEIYRTTKDKNIKTQTVILGSYAVMLIFSMALIIHIRHNRHLALKGDAEAARKIILPAFEPVLWTVSVLSTAYLLAYGSTMSSDFFTIKVTLVTIEMIYAHKQFINFVVPIFIITQKSISIPPLLRSLVISVCLSGYTVLLVWLLQRYGRAQDERFYYWIVTGAHGLELLPFIYASLRPPTRASRRTLCEYTFFLIVMDVGFYFTALEMVHRGNIDASVNISYASVAWSATCPFFMWRLLRADTEHWRGIGQRAVELQSKFRRNGKMEERTSSKGLHVLIEMHRKLIIDFAHLDIQDKMAEGEKSIVFRGTLHSKQTPVAIKMYTPASMNESTVAEFSHEAALCGALRHPNILRFYGMCVCPPAILFVSELCQGSLKLVTQVNASKSMQHHQRQQLLINVGYMLDAARAVTYLHSFSPAFVHRDIRPSNFLVDATGCVKLADFGASRTLSGLSNFEDTSSSSFFRSRKKILTMPQLPEGVAEYLNNPKRMPEYMAPEIIRRNDAGRVIYGEAADVYALAMTFWDVMYPDGVKYTSSMADALMSSPSSVDVEAEMNRPLRDSDIFNMVFAGQRPNFDEHVYPPLRDLIVQGWHTDPRHRPSADGMVEALEAIQEELCAVLAMELVVDLDCCTSQSLNGAGNGNRPPSAEHKARVGRLRDVVPVYLPGTRAINHMTNSHLVDTTSEGVRVGNMLMDAGFLHHIKHARCMENSSALYFFDEDAIQYCQPLAMLEEGTASVDQEVKSPDGRAGVPPRPLRKRLWSHHSDASSSRGELSRANSSNALLENRPFTRCSCRKLAQRLESAQVTQRRLRRKLEPLTEENLLTTKLLGDDANGDFNAFNGQDTYDVGRMA